MYYNNAYKNVEIYEWYFENKGDYFPFLQQNAALGAKNTFGVVFLRNIELFSVKSDPFLLKKKGSRKTPLFSLKKLRTAT